MKKSFKRFLSSVLATVMAVAGMSIGMTTTAMAATQSYELYYVTSSNYVNTDSYFALGTSTSIQTSSSSLITDTSSITNIDGESLTLGGAVKFDSKGSISFSTTASDSTVTIWWAAKQGSSSTCTLKLDDTTLADTASGSTFTTTTISNVAAGSHTLARSASNECEVYYVRVDENFSDTAATYTFTGTSNLTSGDSFNFGTTTAEVGDGGAWTATLTLDSAPTDTDTFAVSKDGYTVDQSSVTVTGSGTAYTVSNKLTFTQLVLTAIPAGTYDADAINAGLPYFDLSGIESGSGSNGRGSIKILLAEDATVTINGTCGSSNTSKYVTLSFGDVSATIYGKDAAADYTSTVAAGELEISMASDDTTFKTTSITIAYDTIVTKYTWEANTDALNLLLDTSKIGFANTTTTDTTNTLTYSGTDYKVKSDKATVTGTPDDNNVITVLVTDDFFEAVTVGDNAITDKATLVADETLATALGSALSTDYTYGKFVLMNGMSVDDDNSVTVDGLGSYTYRLKTGGKPSNTTSIPDRRAIKFETSGPATLQVVGVASGSSNTYTYAVWNSSGSIISTPTVTSTAATSSLITLPSADTYYIASYSGTCIFYSVNVVVGSIDTTSNTYGSSFFDIADGYIIANVATGDLENDSIVVTANETSVTDTVVYAAALIDGHLITAEDLGADYIYVVKGTNAVTNDKTDVLKAFTVSFE